jgi:hypothetical protein
MRNVMDEKHFEIVFDKLDERDQERDSVRSLALESERLTPELEEIAELRRLVAELNEPEPLSYTTS